LISGIIVQSLVLSFAPWCLHQWPAGCLGSLRGPARSVREEEIHICCTAVHLSEVFWRICVSLAGAGLIL